MNKRVIISRQLTEDEKAEVSKLHEQGVPVYSTTLQWFEPALLVEELTAERKREINYQVMNDLLALGDLEVGCNTFSNTFRIEQASLWHYHKFRIYFATRNLSYELAQIEPLLNETNKVVWFCDRSLDPLVSLFGNIDFRFELRKMQAVNIKSLLAYLFLVKLRIFIQLFSARSKAEYMLYFPEKFSTVLDPNTLEPRKGHHILEYLIAKLDDNSQLLTEVLMPKMKGGSDFMFDSWFLKTRWSGRKKQFIEPFLVTGLLSPKVKAHVKRGMQKLTAGYEQAMNTPMNQTQQIAVHLLKSLHKSSRFFLFRYYAAKKIFQRSNVKVIVASDENSPLSRSILDAARSSGIRVVGLQHGTIHDLHPAYRYTVKDREQHIMPDVTVVWGEFWKQFLIEKGNYAPGSLIEAGQLRTDIIPKLLSLQKKQESDNNAKRIVFASQPQRDPRLRYQAAYDVFRAISDLGNCLLILRLHPREFNDIDYYTAIASEVGCSNYIVDLKSDLYALIASCDLLVTCFSTVGAETIYFEKPLIVLDHLKQDIQGYVKAGVAFQATNASELKQVISEIISGAKAINPGKYQSFIRDYAYKIDGEVAERVIKAITLQQSCPDIFQ